MNQIKDYKEYFNRKVGGIECYLKKNNLKAMVLGISGGIDSTVVAALCHEVSKRTGIPLIGRSLPIKNKEDELDASVLVGTAFCDDFKAANLHKLYETYIGSLAFYENALEQTPIANGNIQARLRMIYLYNLAGIKKGIVMDTGNMTEKNLGFFTIHGDHGDLNPIHDIWKTQVYELAQYILERYEKEEEEQPDIKTEKMIKALRESIALVPTDGLGISNSDLEQIGAKSYKDVDDILGIMVDNCGMVECEKLNDKIRKYGSDVVGNIISRHIGSEYKRGQFPRTV